MRHIFIIIVLFLFALPGWSQELSRRQERQLLRELKKEQKAEEAARKAELVDWMVKHRHFVLEAYQLRDKRGNTVHVQANINFIALDSLSGVIQIGSNSYIGMNGVGGVTVEGTHNNYKYTRNKKNGTYQVSYILRTVAGTYDVRMIVLPEGRAEATVSSSWPGQLNYIGYLVPPSVSKVYKGISY